MLHDITRLRHLENVRRDFVANVSHELRTPITSIKGFVETLLHENLQDRDQSLRFLGIVLKQVNRLDAIIEDLLMLSRVEGGSGEQRIPLEPIRLREVLQAAVEMCERIAADNRQIPLELSCPADLMIRANAPLIEQAVVNLIDNAIKYSPPDATVRICRRQEGDHVVIRVRDEGCGIAAKHLPRLFERFYRVDKAQPRTRRHRPGPGDCQAHCQRSPRDRAGREHRRPREHLLDLPAPPAAGSGRLTIF